MSSANQARAAGRPKSYDRDDVLEAATDLFRLHGYAGTSTELLVQTLGVNRNSLYREFGSKQALFEAVLDRYDQAFMQRHFGPLERPGAGGADVDRLFDSFARAAEGPALGRGCLLCNTAVEFGGEVPAVAVRVDRYVTRMRRALLGALKHGIERGELRPDLEVEHEAGVLMSMVLGVFVLLRARAPVHVVRAAAEGARAHVGALCVAPPASGASA